MLPTTPNKLAGASYSVATIKLIILVTSVGLLMTPELYAATKTTTTPPPKTFETNLSDALGNWNHTHDNNAIDLKLASFAWSKMDSVYRDYVSQRVNRSKPEIVQLFEEAQVSSGCKLAISQWMDHYANLEHWATLMWTSWGNFLPSGIFEGSFTDLGSHRGCFGVKDNEIIGETQYCTLDYQPIIPTRPRFHSIFKKVLDVDEQTGKLTHGDYESHLSPGGGKSEAAAGWSSKLVSHNVASEKFGGPKSKELSSNYLRKLPYSRHKLSTASMVELARRAQYFYYVSLRIGTCWPTKCSMGDIRNVSRLAGSRAILQATKVHCVTNSDHRSIKLNNHQLLALLVLGSIAIIILLASLIDLLCTLMIFFEFKQMGELLLNWWPVPDFLDVCSLQRNFVRLFTINSLTVPSLTSTTETMTGGKQQHSLPLPRAKQLTCLNGLRIVTMIWIIYGHTLLNNDYQTFTHAFKILEEGLTNFLVLPTLMANFGVDTFFVISGLLSSYIIFSLKVKFNGLLYTVARYFRLTPQLLIVILMFFLLPLAGDGPIYRQNTELHAKKCYENFWLNLLYLQTYINRQNMCMITSWWLSIEMTFHLISLIVIYALIRRPKLGLIINFLIIIGLTLIGSIVHYKHGFAIQYLPSIPQAFEVEAEQTRWFYHRPYPHAAAYFIGLALGYGMAKNYFRTLNRLQLGTGWAACIFGLACSLCGTYYWNQGAPYTQLQATIYYHLCQILWPISIAWIILVCSLGQGGVLNTILSARFFVPLGRITYMTYLSHILVVYFHSASVLHTVEPSMLNVLYVCIANIVLSLCFGTILSLFYEAPLLNIQRIILRRGYSKVEVSVIIPADTNGLSNQLIIESDAMAETRKSQERFSYRKTLIDNNTQLDGK